MIDMTPIQDIDENTWQTIVQKATHDVRNLLAILQNYSEVALQSKGKDTSFLTEKIAREGLRVARETDIFFDFLSFRSYPLMLSLENCSLSEILTSVDTWMRTQFSQKTFTLLLPPLNTECIVDKRLFSSAILAFTICCLNDLNSGDTLIYGAESKHTQIRYFFQSSHTINSSASFLFLYALEILRLHHIRITPSNILTKEFYFHL